MRTIILVVHKWQTIGLSQGLLHKCVRRFIDVRTLLKGGQGFMKLGYLVDYVMREVKPLDWHKARAGRGGGRG